MHELPLLLTVDETAEILRTTRKGVYAMVDEDSCQESPKSDAECSFAAMFYYAGLTRKSAPSLFAGTKHPAARNVAHSEQRHKP